MTLVHTIAMSYFRPAIAAMKAYVPGEQPKPELRLLSLIPMKIPIRPLQRRWKFYTV